MADTPKTPDWLKLITMKPGEAYDWFASKGIITSFRWTDLWKQEHAAAVTVAGMLQEDLLATVKAHLEKAIADGTSAADFEKALTPIMQDAGWWGKKDITHPDTGEIRTAQLGSPTRIKLIYDTNVRSAYAAGRWQQAEETKDLFPFMMYQTMQDERVRVSHAAWDGITLPIDDPFWNTHYPPNGYRCRCTAVPVDEDTLKEYQAAGIQVKRAAPPQEMKKFVKDGETIMVPAGIDPGFDYNVGKARTAGLKPPAGK